MSTAPALGGRWASHGATRGFPLLQVKDLDNRGLSRT